MRESWYCVDSVVVGVVGGVNLLFFRCLCFCFWCCYFVCVVFLVLLCCLCCFFFFLVLLFVVAFMSCVIIEGALLIQAVRKKIILYIHILSLLLFCFCGFLC